MPDEESEEMLDLSAPIVWQYEPICYKRTEGRTGLIVGGKIYAFEKNGAIESCDTLSRGMLGRILTLCFPEDASMDDVLDQLQRTTPQIHPSK